jgi:hypothetical protein
LSDMAVQWQQQKHDLSDAQKNRGTYNAFPDFTGQ